jgi:hypothetical protein
MIVVVVFVMVPGFVAIVLAIVEIVLAIVAIVLAVIEVVLAVVLIARAFVGAGILPILRGAAISLAGTCR